MEKSWGELYLEKFGGELIPMYEVQGNEVLANEYQYDTDRLYYDCIRMNKRWEEVIGYEHNPNVLY